MDDFYLWLKALHIMAVISWMAALFYLPRLMVYHADSGVGSAQSETFKIMEHRLLKAIMTPAMIASWVFGLSVAYGYDLFGDGWLHVKLVLVLSLSGFHGLLARHVRIFARDENRHSSRYFRIINEIPTVVMAVVVIVVVLKPF